MVNFSDKSDRDFWNSRIFQEEQQKAIDTFLKETMSSFRYQLALENL